MTEDQVERLEIEIDRLDTLVAMITNLRTLQPEIHVSALREILPGIAANMRSAITNGQSNIAAERK